MNDYLIALDTSDGKTFAFHSTPQESLLEAALRQDILLPANCRSGSCGACVARVETGLIQLTEVSNSVLNDAQRAQGQVLMCRAYAESDVHLKAPYTSDKVRLQQIIVRNATIVRLEFLAQGTLGLWLQLQPHETFGTGAEFEPGQYMELRVPGTDQWRPFSLASIPNWDGAMQFILTLRADGLLSNHLRHHAEIGQSLEVRGPFGDFSLQETGRSRWFIAGGSGLAPELSMLRRMADWGDDTPARLYVGVRHDRDLFLLDALDALKQQLSGLTVHLCVSRPEPQSARPARNIVEAFRADLAQAARKPDVYVCGSDRLLAGIRSAAQQGGVPGQQIFTESFDSAP
jgi:ferredoxin-NADP reductase/ferredoxin